VEPELVEVKMTPFATVATSLLPSPEDETADQFWLEAPQLFQEAPELVEV
jgi:hypothetical protein